MFYTKYRPQKFSEIQKPNETADALVNEIKSDKTVHAYLFVGPRGTGKTTTARILAKALNCTDLQKNGDPCGECANCKAIQAGNFVDLIEIDAASNRGIDDIRDLRDKVRLAPSIGKRKIYIIDEVHMLSTDAFNAFLKTLEEPPRNTVFILCTTEFHKVPETIKSRCQVFRFKRATLEQLVNKLHAIAKTEKAKVEDTDLEKIALASLGGYRDAETLLQQIIEGEVDIESFLNTSPYETYQNFTALLLDRDAAGALTVINKSFESGTDLYMWTGEFLRYLRSLLFIKAGVSDEVLDVTAELLKEIKGQAGACTNAWLIKTLNLFMEAQRNVRSSFIPQLPIELAIVDTCSFENDGTVPSAKPTAKPSSSTSAPSMPKKVEKFVEILSKEPDDATEPELADVKISFSLVETKWTELVQKVSKINNSVSALLKAGKPRRLEGRFVVLEVSYAFHKERLESAKNRELVEKALSEVYEANLGIKCDLIKSADAGKLTDFNITVPASNVKDTSALLEVFDGGLPLTV
jgi:DNA polymerase-3 subunit gamma/tau